MSKRIKKMTETVIVTVTADDEVMELVVDERGYLTDPKTGSVYYIDTTIEGNVLVQLNRSPLQDS